MKGDLTHGVGVTGRPICLNPQELHLKEFPKMTMSRNNGWVRSLIARNYLDFHSNVEVFKKSVLHKDKLVWGPEAEEQPKSIRNLCPAPSLMEGLAAPFWGTEQEQLVSKRRGRRLLGIQQPYPAVGCTVASAMPGSHPSWSVYVTRIGGRSLSMTMLTTFLFLGTKAWV